MQNIILLFHFFNEYSYLIFSAIGSFLLFTFVLDGFQLSNQKFIKFLQIFFLIFLFLQIYLFFNIIYASEGSDPNLMNEVKEVI